MLEPPAAAGGLLHHPHKITAQTLNVIDWPKISQSLSKVLKSEITKNDVFFVVSRNQKKHQKKTYSEEEVWNAFVRTKETEDNLASDRRAKQVRQSQHSRPDVLAEFERLPTIRHNLANHNKKII